MSSLALPQNSCLNGVQIPGDTPGLYMHACPPLPWRLFCSKLLKLFGSRAISVISHRLHHKQHKCRIIDKSRPFDIVHTCHTDRPCTGGVMLVTVKVAMKSGVEAKQGAMPRCLLTAWPRGMPNTAQITGTCPDYHKETATPPASPATCLLGPAWPRRSLDAKLQRDYYVGTLKWPSRW